MYWLLISSTLYDIYAREVMRGARYETPDQKITIKLTQLGFVDDVNNQTNLPWTNLTNTSDLLQMASPRQSVMVQHYGSDQPILGT
jgi:hypothetical protein